MNLKQKDLFAYEYLTGKTKYLPFDLSEYRKQVKHRQIRTLRSQAFAPIRKAERGEWQSRREGCEVIFNKNLVKGPISPPPVLVKDNIWNQIGGISLFFFLLFTGLIIPAFFISMSAIFIITLLQRMNKRDRIQK